MNCWRHFAFPLLVALGASSLSAAPLPASDRSQPANIDASSSKGQAAQETPESSFAERLENIETILEITLEKERQAVEKAELARAEANRLSKVARSNAAQSKAERVAAEEAAKAAEAKALSAQQEVEKLAEAVSERTKELEKAQDQSERLAAELKQEAKFRNWIAVAGLVAVFLGLIVARSLLHRQRNNNRKNIEGILEERPDPVNDCVLVGEEQHVQLSGRQLPLACGGVILGRNPELASATLSYEDVSRQHAKFFHDGAGYFVEDLSTFGTKLDGDLLSKGKPRGLAQGSVLEIADHTFEFRILGHAA